MKAAEFDLHTHTTVSDGQYTPLELLDRAHHFGVRTLSITDHDSVGAYTDETFEHAKSHGIDLIPGIEISSRDQDAYRFHILGLGIDPDDEELIGAIEGMNRRRGTYAAKVVSMFEEAGYSVDRQGLFESGATVTKAAIADSILSQSENSGHLAERFGGHMPNRGEFIEGLMLKGKEFYIPSPNSISPLEAIRVIKHAGGLAIMAHPVSGPHEGHDRAVHIEKIMNLPLDGLEAFYIYYAKSLNDLRIDEIAFYSQLARDKEWLISAGSDFHSNGSRNGQFVELGFANQPLTPGVEILNALLQALKRC